MIYTECKPDSSLMRILGIPNRQIIHLQGKPEVCKQLEKRERFIGLVDEDPFSVQPSYLKRLPVKEDLPSCGLKILNDTYKNNDLIILCPRLESWILKVAKEAGIDIKRYNLPNSEEKLHKEINTDLRKFERLLNDLKGKSRMMDALEKAIMEQDE
jgi:hypothetical protein